MKVPAWSFRARRGASGKYDRARVREIVVRFPHDAPPGGYVMVDTMIGTQVIGEPTVFTLTAEQAVSEDLGLAVAVWLQAILAEEEVIPESATLAFLEPAQAKLAEPTPDVETRRPPGRTDELAPGGLA